MSAGLHTSAALTAEQGAGLSSTDACDPSVCALGRRPHCHCVCGLAMEPRADRCGLCEREGLEWKPCPDSRSEVWDGVSRPSRRRHRLSMPDPGPYELLLAAVFGDSHG